MRWLKQSPWLLVLAAIAWTAAVAPHDKAQHHGSPLIYPILWGLPVMIVWYLDLLNTRERKLLRFLEMVLAVIFYVALGFFELMLITHEGI